MTKDEVLEKAKGIVANKNMKQIEFATKGNEKIPFKIYDYKENAKIELLMGLCVKVELTTTKDKVKREQYIFNLSKEESHFFYMSFDKLYKKYKAHNSTSKVIKNGKVFYISKSPISPASSRQSNIIETFNKKMLECSNLGEKDEWIIMSNEKMIVHFDKNLYTKISTKLETKEKICTL